MESGRVAMRRAVDRPFRMLVFDWDGTAVTDRQEDPAALRAVIGRLLRQNVAIVAVTGTHKGHLERQLADGLRGPHKRNLYLATHRGSEIFSFDEEGVASALWHRAASAEEDRQLTAAAESLRDALVRRTGLEIGVILDRLNRRKVDLIPVPEWADPPKSELGPLYAAVQARLIGSGLAGGMADAVAIAALAARSAGLPDPRITSDGKHIEIGLTDKGDAVRWVLENVAHPRGIEPSEILVAGDEFGSMAGLPGSDSLLIVPEAQEAVFVSVGAEPGGVPLGVLHLPGGPERFRALLTDLAAQTTLPVSPFPDPEWLLVEEGFNVVREHEVESLLAIGNGYVGTRASLAEGSRLSAPATFVAGVFEAGNHGRPTPELLQAPDWLNIHGSIDGSELRLEPGSPGTHRRILDMREGILWREWDHQDPAGRRSRISAIRIASLADRHVLYQSLAFRPDNFSGDTALETSLEGGSASQIGPFDVVTRTTSDGTTVAFASWSRLLGPGAVIMHPDEQADLPGKTSWRFRAAIGATYRLDRTVVVRTARDAPDPVAAACGRLAELMSGDVTAMVGAHREAWYARWRAADVRIAGDSQAQRAVRFAGYHLSSAANPDDDRISIGARGLTGAAYKGHFFWDTEVHLIPYYTLTWPEAAKALLTFRHRTLPEARRKARELGFQGALYPWEATTTGEEATPPFALGPDGRVIPIATRNQAHHISAAVAHAVWRYWEATGDDRFLQDLGAEMLLETARFWASRCRLGQDGQYHIDGVVGPDEYHDDVADDAYTNGMAQWNLETGAAVAAYLADRCPRIWASLAAQMDLGPAEPARWSEVAAAMYTGQDARTGLFEQFRGYFDLPDLELAPFEERLAPPDILLGHGAVRHSRVIKQAGVLMLFFLLPERFSREIQEVNYGFYAPRTAHGSSLSPGVHASVAARLGHTDAALRYFRQAADIDLANNMGNAAGGVHMAALGSLWQAVVFGFGGLGRQGADLSFDPRLPDAWQSVRMRLRWRGRHLEAGVGPGPSWNLREVSP